jgi:hypothetical protein
MHCIGRPRRKGTGSAIKESFIWVRSCSLLAMCPRKVGTRRERAPGGNRTKGRHDLAVLPLIAVYPMA